MKRKRTNIYEAQVGRNKTRAVRNVKVFFYIFKVKNVSLNFNRMDELPMAHSRLTQGDSP